MADVIAALTLTELPADATNAQALAWVARMRRMLDRWEMLPGHDTRSMTPELRQQAYDELAELEQRIDRNMQIPQGA
jgi:hypothetical protein